MKTIMVFCGVLSIRHSRVPYVIICSGGGKRGCGLYESGVCQADGGCAKQQFPSVKLGSKDVGAATGSIREQVHGSNDKQAGNHTSRRDCPSITRRCNSLSKIEYGKAVCTHGVGNLRENYEKRNRVF